MRISIAFGVAAVSIFAFAIFWDNAPSQAQVRRQTLIKYTSPNIPDEFNGKITYAMAVRDPAEPPTATDDGPSIYRKLHRNGWNGCLWSFYVDRQYGDEPMWRLGGSNDIFWQSQPDHHNVAENDGWFACVDMLQAQLKTKTEKELRLQLKSNLASVYANQEHISSLLSQPRLA